MDPAERKRISDAVAFIGADQDVPEIVRELARDLRQDEVDCREEEGVLEMHADFFNAVWNTWADASVKYFSSRPQATTAEVVSIRAKARFAAAVSSNRPQHLPPVAALALNLTLRSLRGRKTWDQLHQAASKLLSVLMRQTRANLASIRVTEGHLDNFYSLWDQTLSYGTEIGFTPEELLSLGAPGAAPRFPPANRLTALPLPGSLPAEAAPAGTRKRRRSQPSDGGCRGASNILPDRANMDPVVLRRLRLAAARAVRALGRGERKLEIELDLAEAARLAAHESFEAHSLFFADLKIQYSSFEDGPAEGPVTAGVRDGFALAIQRNLPALARLVGEGWSDDLDGSLQALQTPVNWGVMVSAANAWMKFLTQKSGTNLWTRGEAKTRRDALQLRLAQARSDSSAARFAVLALDVLSRRMPADRLPAAVQLPADFLPARLPAEFPQAELPPAVVQPVRRSLAVSRPARTESQTARAARARRDVLRRSAARA